MNYAENSEFIKDIPIIYMQSALLAPARIWGKSLWHLMPFVLAFYSVHLLDAARCCTINIRAGVVARGMHETRVLHLGAQEALLKLCFQGACRDMADRCSG
jgi:hypothetical protein